MHFLTVNNNTICTKYMYCSLHDPFGPSVWTLYMYGFLCSFPSPSPKSKSRRLTLNLSVFRVFSELLGVVKDKTIAQEKEFVISQPCPTYPEARRSSRSVTCFRARSESGRGEVNVCRNIASLTFTRCDSRQRWSGADGKDLSNLKGVRRDQRKF